jgi:hypothetical protein
MGKETRDLLKKILSTQEQILKHLKIGASSTKKKAAAGKNSSASGSQPAPKKSRK